MLGSTAGVDLTFWDYLFPNESRLLLIKRNRVEVSEGTVKNLVTTVEVESK
jgi:hypothetical protein